MNNFFYSSAKYVLSSSLKIIICAQLIVGGAHAAMVCATAEIEILQSASLERQAFEARMHIQNTLDGQSLEQVQIDLFVSDDAGNEVALTSDPNATDAAFYVSLGNRSGLSAIDGSARLLANSSADLSWTLIPAANSAGDLPSGKRYYVGASVSYLYEGATQTIDVAPDYITVTPPPQLVLDYF